MLDTQFHYILANLELANINLIGVAGSLIVGLALVAFFAWFWRVTLGWKLTRLDSQASAKKKETLSNLILMKDIQTELEKEIEQAMLKATFQD